MKKLVENIKRLTFPASDDDVFTGKRLQDVSLILPGNLQKGKAPELSQKKLVANFMEVQGDGALLLNEALQYIQKLNHAQIKIPARFLVTNIVLEQASSAICDVYLKYARESRSVPENSNRKKDLGNCVCLLHELGISYKHAFRHDYELGNSKYNQVRDRVYECAVRILELLKWEQRLRALRYQKLSDICWQHCNQVFFSMLCCEDIEHTLESMIDINAVHGNSGHYIPGKSVVTLNDLYISIQMMGLFDLISYPHNFIYTADNYLQHIHAPLQIKQVENVTDGNRIVYIHCNQSTPPVFENQKNNSNTVMGIDIGGMLEQFENDYAALMGDRMLGEKKKHNLPLVFSKLSNTDSLSLIEILKSKLVPSERKDDRRPVYGGRSISLYAGFAACYRLLCDMDQTDDKHAMGDRNLLDAMAQYSTLIVDNSSHEQTGYWSVINESNGGMLISTADSQYTMSMDVGQIVAWRIDIKEHSMPHVGYINRFVRSREGSLDVAIVTISNDMEYVAVNDPSAGDDKNLLAGILFNIDNNSWNLILQPHNAFVPGTPLMMKRSEESIPARIGKILLSKRGFTIFEVRGPKL